MPEAVLSFLRAREKLMLPVLVGFAGLVALTLRLATLNGYLSPRIAMVFAALLCAIAAAWYARGFLEERGENGGGALLLSAAGWALVTISFLLRAGNHESRAATFFVLGAVLLVLAGASLALSSLLVGGANAKSERASTRAATKPVSTTKDLGDALRDARDL